MKKYFSFLTVVILIFAFTSMAAGPYPNKQFGQDLGKDGRSYKDLYLKNSIIFEGTTSDGYETTLSITEPTADRTITFPDSSGTVALEPNGATMTFEGATADDYETTISVVDPTADRTVYVPNASGIFLLSPGAAADAANTFQGTNNGFIFEGATADAYETTLTVTDPTADRTVTIPDATGTVVLSSGAVDVATAFWGAANSIIFEGATADAYELTLAATDPAADVTVTIPAKTGTLLINVKNVTAKTQADTPVTVTAATYNGQILTNSGASGGVVFNLPEASTVIGQSFTFVVVAAQNLDVNPDNGDTILRATNANGDAIRNATAGGSVTLTAIDATNWVITAYYGSWSDVN